MSNVAKIAALLLLIAAAGGLYFLNSGTAAPTPPPISSTPVITPVEQKPTRPKAVEAPQRVAQTDRVTASGNGDNAHADAPQGVKGRVLLPNGQPAVGVKVMLLENAMSNAIDMFLKNQTGQVSPPLATTVTVEDGSFALGVLKAGQNVDLRVVSESHPEIIRAPLKIASDDWPDLGDLDLESGLIVQGRVVDAMNKSPVADASVYLNSTNRSHSMVTTPGREKGILMVTDASGNFRFENAPRIGSVNIKVEADGYAVTNLLGQQIRIDSVNQMNIEIEPGRSITGVVIDDQGQRIRGVKIVASGLSSKTPQTAQAYSDDQGEFEFTALRSGPYRLKASASNFTDVDVPLAITGEDIKVVMAKRGSVKLRVLSSKGREIKNYRLSLKRAFPNNPTSIGNVFDFADRSISPRNYKRGWAMIDGLPSGTFCFQLSERSHAKTLSETFLVKQGAEPIEITVNLTNGGEIIGKVIDDQGQPVAGATVSSDMNSGLAADTGLFEMFRSMIPEKHTARSVKTNKQGEFRIGQLSFADYMIRVSHSRFCQGTKIDISLQQEGEVVDAGVIQLEKGTLIEGTTTIDGQPAGQVKVTISVPSTGNQPLRTNQPSSTEAAAEAARRLFSAKVLSDGDGRFIMLKRVPPGTYKVTAARASADSPFMALLDMKQSEQELVIAPGQERAVINFNLNSR